MQDMSIMHTTALTRPKGQLQGCCVRLVQLLVLGQHPPLGGPDLRSRSRRPTGLTTVPYVGS